MLRKNNCKCNDRNIITDYGPNPFVINIRDITLNNNKFRTAIWTGKNLQITTMCIPIRESIGLECHPDTEQLIVIVQGDALVQMGDSKSRLDFERKLYNNCAVVIPAGTWHNVINIGNIPIKLYSVYAPPQHPWGTVHNTKKDAEYE